MKCIDLPRFFRAVNKQLDEGFFQEWNQEFHWIAPHNLWIAARDGLEGDIINDLEGRCVNISNPILDLVDQLSPIAKNLDCLEELEY
jgi:gamma-glutamyl:cysteine ligase YbdK (ATP-grasp superfamily)